MNRKKQFFICLTLTAISTFIYSWNHPQFSAALRELLADGARLPTFFASDYFSGLEYGYIGNHLSRGHGFVGPFEHITSPTATMPPVLPLVYATVFSICGFKTVASFWVIFILRTLSVATGFFLLLQLAATLSEKGIIRAAMLLALVFATGNLFFFFYDEWFMWLFAAISLSITFNILHQKEINWLQVLGFGTWLGLALLTQTVMGAALAGAWLMTALRFRYHKMLWAIPVAIGIMMPWVFRNYAVFGSVMPVKSNLGFELYFSTVHESRGILILEEQNQSKKHPIKPGPEREYALQLGEHEYQRRKTEEFLNILRNNPARYLEKVAYRLMYATVAFPFSTEEQKVHNPAPALIKYLLYPTVFLFWCMQWFMPGRRRPFVFFCLMLYAAYLGPYILINFWLKYWVHMLPLYAVIVGLSASEFYRLYIKEGES